MIRKSTRNCCCIISVQCHSWQLPLSRFPKLVPCFKWWKIFMEFIHTKAINRFSFFPAITFRRTIALHFNTFNKFPVQSQQKLQQTKWQFKYDIITFRNNVGRWKREISLSMQLCKKCAVCRCYVRSTSASASHKIKIISRASTTIVRV